MGELNRYNIGEPQSEQNREPNTIASATTVVPVHKLTFITGTVAIANVTPPVAGMHVLYFIFTNANPSAFTGAGNVTGTYDPQQNVVTTLVYDPVTKKYFTGAIS
jgi:hypothetical protein